MRYAAKVDQNQGIIVEALRKAGASVYVSSRFGGGFPDLIVSWWDDDLGITRTCLMEVKTEKGYLTKKEREFLLNWKGQINIVRTPEQALEVIGR